MVLVFLLHSLILVIFSMYFFGFGNLVGEQEGPGVSKQALSFTFVCLSFKTFARLYGTANL